MNQIEELAVRTRAMLRRKRRTIMLASLAATGLAVACVSPQSAPFDVNAQGGAFFDFEGSSGHASASGGFSGVGSSNGGSLSGVSGAAASGGSQSGASSASATGGASTQGGTSARGGATASGGASAGRGGQLGLGGTRASGGAAPENDGGSATGDAGQAGSTVVGGSSADGSDDFFGDSRCDNDLDLCEDFESGTLDTQRWSTMGTAPAIESTRAARGKMSAHFHTTGNGLMLIRETETFPAVDNRYYGRMFVYFEALPTAPQWAHWSIVGAVGSFNDAEIRVGGQYDGESNRFGVGTDGGPTGDWTLLDDDPKGAAEAVPLKTWLCVEWMHDADDNETRFYLNGDEHESLHTTATVHGGSSSTDYELPAFESVWVGWWLYQKDPTPSEFDVYIDEIAIDGERIGCTR